MRDDANGLVHCYGVEGSEDDAYDRHGYAPSDQGRDEPNNEFEAKDGREYVH
jgi:hypothetical protein